MRADEYAARKPPRPNLSWYIYIYIYIHPSSFIPQLCGLHFVSLCGLMNAILLFSFRSTPNFHSTLLLALLISRLMALILSWRIAILLIMRHHSPLLIALPEEAVLLFLPFFRQSATPRVHICLQPDFPWPESSHLPGCLSDTHVGSRPHCDEPVRKSFEQKCIMRQSLPIGCIIVRS